MSASKVKGILILALFVLGIWIFAWLGSIIPRVTVFWPLYPYMMTVLIIEFVLLVLALKYFLD